MTELIEERVERVLVLTMSGPATRNALGPAVYETGTAALARAGGDPGIGAVVLTGADGAFCSGGDLGRLAGLRGEGDAAVRRGIDGLHGLIRAMRACPKPVIAAVDGVAAGAGFSLALACDLIVSASDARFVLAYVKVGLSPDGGATAFLSQALPRPMAAAIALEGGVVTAERLHQLGVVTTLCPPGTARAAALAEGGRLAAGPSGAMASIKGLLNAAYGDSLDAQLDRERDAFAANLLRPDAGEGIAAFLEKRPARFHGEG